jgi:pimeloyl-ACP methyl ester carboxylesterase
LSAFGEAGNECIAGGKPEGAGRPTGYGSYGQTAAEYDSLMFHDTDPAVLKAANDARTMDPCGDIESILNGVVSDVLGVGSIDVPVVYVWGTEDANYVSGSPWWQLQEGFYTSSPKVTDVTLENTGHAVTLERSAPQLMDSMDRWLKENQL